MEASPGKTKVKSKAGSGLLINKSKVYHIISATDHSFREYQRDVKLTAIQYKVTSMFI